jgi:VIT1/CCC1 family predicted Fe2+/Mn2+ transporter
MTPESLAGSRRRIKMTLSPEIQARILSFQKNEITEYHIYSRLAQVVRSAENREVLRKIADDEKRHYEIWKGLSGEDVPPDRGAIFRYTWISRILGFTFGVKLMERGEGMAQEGYGEMVGKVEPAALLLREEAEHERKLLGLLDEEILRYAGSVVLGLNDALVELTGALAGLTLALQNTRLIALTGLITGVAAALSMAASEYLSMRSEGGARSPLRAALYTGAAYIVTVFLLILPYLVLGNYYLCLALTLFAAMVVIAAFNFYISVAKDEPFRRRFVEMAALSFGVAAFSFLLGYLIRTLLGVEV